MKSFIEGRVSEVMMEPAGLANADFLSWRFGESPPSSLPKHGLTKLVP